MKEKNLDKLGIIHKTIDEQLVVSLNFKGTSKDVPMNLEKLVTKCKKYICGPTIIVNDFGVYSKDFVDITICLPIKKGSKIKDVEIKKLPKVEVLAVLHHGVHEKLNDSYRTIYNFMNEKGIEGTAFSREIIINYNPIQPEENITELQIVLHKWEDRFAKNVERVLGKKIKNELMKDSEILFTLESTLREKNKWLKIALNKLDEVATEEQKYEILSCCAHEFSDKRINYMKSIYQKTGSIDAVLEEMYKDYAWYEAPKRTGNIISVTKIPYNLKGYNEAKTKEEKLKNYCHCLFVRGNLKEGVSPSFCWCGSGWYRRLWEGIIGKPVKIELLKSLVKGDDVCEYAIHLPLDELKVKK